MVKSGRLSFESHFKLSQITKRCEIGENHIRNEYDVINPYDNTLVENKNRLVNFIQILDQDFIDLKRLRNMLFKGVPFIENEW